MPYGGGAQNVTDLSLTFLRLPLVCVLFACLSVCPPLFSLSNVCAFTHPHKDWKVHPFTATMWVGVSCDWIYRDHSLNMHPKLFFPQLWEEESNHFIFINSYPGVNIVPYVIKRGPELAYKTEWRDGW